MIENKLKTNNTINENQFSESKTKQLNQDPLLKETSSQNLISSSLSGSDNAYSGSETESEDREKEI